MNNDDRSWAYAQYHATINEALARLNAAGDGWRAVLKLDETALPETDTDYATVLLAEDWIGASRERLVRRNDGVWVHSWPTAGAW